MSSVIPLQHSDKSPLDINSLSLSYLSCLLSIICGIYSLNMSKHNSSNSDYLLEKAEDYPKWALHTVGLLRQKNCDEAIEFLPDITVDSFKRGLISDGFDVKDLSPSILVKTITDQKTKREERLTRAAGIIQNQVAERHSHLVAGREARDMWIILRERFQDLSPMSTTDILHQLSKRTMTEFSDASQYCAVYEAALDKISGMITSKSKINVESAETIIQGFMLANVSESYAPLIAQYRRDWTEGTVDLTGASKAIANYSGTMKEKPKVLYSSNSSFQGKKRTRPTVDRPCTTPECVSAGRQQYHTTERCYTAHPELKPTNKKPRKTTSTNTESQGEVKPITINS